MTRTKLFETIDFHCFNTPDFDRELFDNWYNVCIHITNGTTNQIPEETVKELAEWVENLIKEIA